VKKLQTHWSSSLGEHAIGLQFGRISKSLSPGQLDLVIVSQRHITCLKDNGQVRAQKRLDYAPACFTLFDLPGTTGGGPGMKMQGLIVGTDLSSIMIYHDLQLIWAAQCDSVPISLKVAGFGGLEGLVTMLDDAGNTRLLYMGTDPPTSAVGAGTNSHKELNYEQMDEEHRRLLGLIREATSETRAEPKDVVVISASEASMSSGAEEGLEGPCAQVRINLKQKGTAAIDNIRFTVTSPEGIICSQEQLQIPRLASGNGTPTVLVVSFGRTGECLPHKLSVHASCSYKSTSGEPRTSHCEVPLPLQLIANVVPGAADATCKFTIDTDMPPVHVPTLYQEMCGEIMQPDGTLPAANLVCFKYASGEEVKIIVSKNAGRYRVQSTSLAAMSHVTLDLCERISTYYQGQGGGSKVAFSFTESIPISDYMELVERHHGLRKSMMTHREFLADRAEQFRSVQKRLLVRFKERNPSPVAHLDLLLQGTYDELLALGSSYEEQQTMLRSATCDLACATRLILRLIKYKFSLEEEDMQVLESHWTTDVDDNLEQGWEERVNSALLLLLRSTMAKAGKKESATQGQQLNVGFLEDVSKLKKHITLVVDRLGKGMRPAGTKGDAKEASAKSS